MGCAPSQREIIQQLAKNTLRPLKKARALGSADKTPTESLTHSISGGLGNSDSESSLSEDVQQNASGPGNKEERRRAGRGHGQHPPPSTVPACTPELYNKERKKEKLTAGDRTVRSEVVTSQKYVPRDMPVHKHQMYSDWHDDAAQQPRRTRKQKGSHATKQTKSAKLRARSHSGGEEEEKVDFPTSLVKAHHAAYAYLNPSLSKYDAILTLTDQAAQTQLMLQQMVSFLILRFEEVNQILEDIATEGERLVKDAGPHLAWPIEKGAGEDRPDLLQQLLQYTVNKMQATNGTVTALAATALQEARGHLQSAADALQQGLAAKQQVDQRLRRMIGQLEGCVWQQPGTRPGDTALYSEDSGIGADTDSLKESCNPEQCGRRASGDPGWHLSGRAALPRTSQRPAKFGTPEPGDGARDCRFGGRPARASRWPSLQDGSEGSFESGGSMEGEALSLGGSLDFGSAGEEDDDGGSGLAPQRPSSSPPESGARRPASPASEAMANRIKDAISHRIRFVPSAPGSAAWSDEEGSRPPARPSSAHGGPGPSPAAERPGRSRSTESLKSRAEDPTLLELQRTGRELSRRLDKMRRAKEGERRRGGGGGRRGDPPEQAEVEVARPKLPAPPPTSPAPNRLKASLRKDFSVLPSQGPGSLRRPPGQGRQAEAEAAPFKRVSPQAKESQAPQAGPQRKSVRGLIDSFSRGRGGGGEAGDDGGGGGPLAALDGTRPSLPSAPATLPRPGRTTQQPEAATFPPPPPPPPAPFPPPPAALELPLDGLTAAAAPMDTCAGAVARVAGNAWAVEGARAAGDACAAAGAGARVAGDACAAAGAGARVAGDACAAAAGSGARAAGDACAVRVAAPAVSRATATQRLLASLDSVALLPSRQPPGGGLGAGARLRRAAEPAAVAPWSGGAKSQEHGAESLRRLKAAAGTGEQWQPYKIINLRYAGASCGSPESGAAPADPPASPLRTAASPPGERRVHSVPREEGAGDDGRAARSPPAPRRCQPAAARKTSSATKPTALSPSVGRKPASPPWHLSPATVHPAPPGPADQSRFPSPALQPNHLFRPIGYAAARRGPEPVWEPGHLPRASASAQPSPPSLRRQLSPRTLLSPPPQASKLSSPPPQASKLSSPPPQASTLPSPPPQASKLSSPPPQASKLSSPPHQAWKLPSPPPQARKLPSPPPQARKLPSPPPQARKLPSPPPQARKLPSPPPQARKLPSPPPQARKLPSPPPPHASGASGHRDHLEADPMSPWPGKIASNASSIFCPSSDSLFEARQPPSPPANHIILGDASPMTSRAAWRNNFMLRQPGDRQRRLTLSGVHPQPFVKRNYLPDCRTGAQTGLPAPGSAGSEPTLHSVGLNSENEGDPWTRHCISNLRGSSRSVSHPELCIIGQGLQ